MELLKNVVLFSSLFASFRVQGAHIVGIPSIGFSHGSVLAKVGREIALRGHMFTLLIPSFQAEENLLYAEVAVKTFETPFTSLDLESAMLAQMEGRLGTFSSAASLWEKTCQNLLNNTKLLDSLVRVDLVLCDIGNMCGPIVADLLQAPRVDISPAGFLDPFLSFMHNIPSPVSFIPQMSFYKTNPELSFLHRVQNTLLYILGYGIYQFLILPPYEGLWRNYVSESKFSNMRELFTSTGLLLVPTDFAFDLPRPVSAHVKVIGPLTPEPAKQLPAEFSDFVMTDEPKDVVIVSFGTVITNFSAEFNDIVASALAKLPIKFIWKCYGFKCMSVANNIKVVPWMPQNDLLGHSATRIFLTHGGLNSLLEAAYHGIPTIVIPLFGDQPRNSVRVQEQNTGLVLSYGGLKPEHIVSAINEVLSNPMYKENAVRLSRLLRHRWRSPAEEAANWVEYGLKNNMGLHLRSPSDNLHFYQLYLIDVIVFLVVVFIMIVFVLSFSLWYFTKWMCNLGLKHKHKVE